MKKLFLFIFVSLTAVIAHSCGDTITTPSLLEAERLAEAYPDSALSILDTLSPALLRNNDERMLRRLLILEANDRNEISQKDDKEINALLDYFIEGNRLRRIHPLVYYYAGRVYSDLNEDAKALSYHKKALNTVHEGEIPSLESRIRAQRAFVYQKHNLFNHSNREIKYFLEIARQNKDTADLIGGHLNLATNYKLNNLSDSAIMIYGKLEKLVKDFGDSVLITTFYSQYAIFYFNKGEYEKADSIINLFPEHTNSASAQSVNFIRNKINQKYKRHVSIDHYLQLLESNRPGYRYSGNMGLAKIAKDNNDCEQAMKYTADAYTSLEEMQKMYSENMLAEMEKIMSDTELKNEILELKNANQSKRSSIIIISGVTLLITILLVIMRYRYNLAKTRKALEMETMKAENRKMLLNLEKQLTEKETIAEAQLVRIKEFENQEAEDQKRFLALEKQLEEKSAIVEAQQERIEKFESKVILENIVDEITDLLFSPHARPTEQHLNRLKDAFSRTNPSFISALDKLSLSPRDYQDALLIRINVPVKTCADYFNVTKQAISNARTRLFQKLGEAASEKNWVKFIHSL